MVESGIDLPTYTPGGSGKGYKWRENYYFYI